MTSESIASELSEWILIRTLPDLRSRITSHDDYDRLGIAHLMRRMLLDARPVVHLARRRLDIPAPMFDFTPYNHASSRLPEGLPLYVSGGFAEPKLRGDLAAFLAAPIGHFRGDAVSVRMLLRYVAHVDGGVHLGRPSDAFEEYLQDGLANFQIMARVMLLNTLADIAEVALRALRPISERLVTEANRPSR